MMTILLKEEKEKSVGITFYTSEVVYLISSLPKRGGGKRE